MDRQTSKLKRLPSILVIVGLVFLVLFFILPKLLPDFGKANHIQAAEQADQWTLAGIWRVYAEAWFRIQARVTELKQAEETTAMLRLEVLHLKELLESAQFSCHSQTGEAVTKYNSLRLTKETGTKIGRTLASINYKPPSMLPSQLYTLGVSYLRAHEDEKVAVIFSTLTGLEETDNYKNAKNYLIAGLAWYRLENYLLADHYFDKVLKQPEGPESIQFQAQSRLWKALVAKKFGKDIKSQYWLHELLDHHPHSQEASWINHLSAESEKQSDE